MIIKQRMLDWAKQFSILCFLDSNSYHTPYGKYESLLAVSAGGGDIATSLSEVQQLHDRKKDWLFGHIAYDHKNELEPGLSSSHTDKTGFPHLQFFVPDTVCHINSEGSAITIESYTDPHAIYTAIRSTELSFADIPCLQFSSGMDKATYLGVISKLRQHIAAGDCYEINFCTEGFCAGADIEPADVFRALNRLSPAPFAAYYRLGHRYLMCASPERYLQRQGGTILSQPMKGTARRDADPAKDDIIKASLKANLKERAENVMIVDLVRNDIARSCEAGSVAVDELFGIYSFPQVHQMVSTVSGRLKEPEAFTNAIRYSFPMGSMTGAPKYKVMQLIDAYEPCARGLFAGTVGYIDPEGNFDLNVVIRSLFYNAGTHYLSYQTGGAITYDSNAEMEWEEMRLKAWAMERIFAG